MISRDSHVDPGVITIPADTEVTIILSPEGSALHNFAVDKLGISIDIAPGEQERVGDHRAGHDRRVLLQCVGASGGREGRDADRRVTAGRLRPAANRDL